MWAASTTKIFLHIPDETGQRTLHPGSVVEADEDRFTAVFEADGLVVEDEQDVFIYCEIDAQFAKLPGRVENVVQDSPRPVLALEMKGEPVAAESRKCHRVSTALSDHAINVAEEPDCQLMDISVVGCAVTSERQYGIGDLVTVRFSYDGASFEGAARVQSIRGLAGDKTRYGLLCVEDRSLDGSLKQGLQKFSMALQREKLRRQGVHG